MKDDPTIITDDQQTLPARRLFRVKAAADYIAVSERTLWTMTNSGEIPSVRFGSGLRQSVRIDLADLDAWIEKHKGGRR